MMEKIILFGTGKYFKHKVELLKRYSVQYIIDNKVSKGQVCQYSDMGIHMINPEDIDVTGNEKIYLMTMNFVSMWQQLVCIGVNPERLIYPFFEKPYFQSDVVVEEMVESISFGINEFCVRDKNGNEVWLSTQDEWFDYLREMYRKKYDVINAISKMEIFPISEQFATERGTPVDRIYIEKFLSKCKEYIQGDVLEIEDAFYTKKYGQNQVKKSIVMDVSKKESQIDFNANIETGEGIRDQVADCFILTQTLMYIFDLKAAAHNIIRLLKPGGIVLITCSCLSQNSKRCMDNYGSYFNFNAAVFEKMFIGEAATVIKSGSYGNVKTVTAHLVGMCAEDLRKEDFEMDDKYYPLIVYAVVKRDE